MDTADASRNMRLLAHHELGGFGNMGEGMVIQLARDGRRVLWLAHESAPKNVTAVDVTEPRKPAVILQTDLPHGDMRSNSLDLAGDLLVVAYQTARSGSSRRASRSSTSVTRAAPLRRRSSTRRGRIRAGSITSGSWMARTST